jgi:hypothetical protein
MSTREDLFRLESDQGKLNILREACRGEPARYIPTAILPCLVTEELGGTLRLETKYSVEDNRLIPDAWPRGLLETIETIYEDGVGRKPKGGFMAKIRGVVDNRNRMWAKKMAEAGTPIPKRSRSDTPNLLRRLKSK